MTEEQQADQKDIKEPKSLVGSMVFWLGLLLVLVGMINVTPGIPGWDDLWKTITGNEFFRVRRFETENSTLWCSS